MNSAPNANHPVMAEPTAMRTLRTTDLLILSIGTFTLGVDGFVLSGLLPQVAVSLHVSASTAGQLTTLFALVYAAGSPSSPRSPEAGTGERCSRQAWPSSSSA